MKRSTTRATTLTLAALLTTGLAVPLTAGPASAVVPANEERLFFTADTGGVNADGSYGLYRKPSPAGTTSAVIAEDANGQQDVYNVSASRDGSRVTYIQDTYSSDFSSGHERIGVTDVSGHFVRYVDDVVFSGTSSTFDYTPALSRDGSTVVWTQISGAGITLKKAAVGGGSASVVTSGLHDAVFLTDTTLLALDNSDAAFSINLDGTGKTAAVGFPSSGLEDVTVSPDGNKVAWTERASSSLATVKVADLTFPSGVATATNPVTIYGTGDNYAPAFSHDNGTVYFIHHDGTSGDIWSSSVDGTTTPAAVTTATANVDEDDVVVTSTDDGTTTPGAPTSGSATAGVSPTVRWALPSDTDLSYVTVKRYLGTSSAGTLQKTSYVNAPLTSYTDSGLSAGSVYTYTVTAVDRSGNVGTASADKTLVAINPTATFSDPTSATTKTAPFPVKLGTGVPSGTPFWVQYRVNSGSTWTTWVNGVAGTTRTFGSAATTGVSATTATPGKTYQFRVQAKDSYGNFTSQVVSGRATVPFDQTSAAFSSGTTYSNSNAWYGSYRVLKAAGAYAKISIVGDRFQLIGARCTTCGVFDVYDNGVKVAALDTYRSSNLYRTVLYTRTWSSISSHTIVIKARGTAGRPNVIVDGFGMRH